MAGQQSDTHSAVLATQQLEIELSKILSNSLAKSTQRTYSYAMGLLSQFVGLTGIAFPLVPAEMALFVTFLRKNGYKYGTIKTYSSAISFFHKIAGFKDPGTSYLVVKTLEGLRKVDGSVDLRLPITVVLLESLVSKALPEVCAEGYNYLLYRAMYIVAFFGLLRVGELTFASNDQQHTLQLENVLYDAESKGYLITINSFKFSKGKPATVRLQCHENKVICPVCCLKAYLLARGMKMGPLFCKANGLPLNRQNFSDCLNKMLHVLGLNEAHYKSHSFRIGGATYAAQLGLSDAEIRQLGRWKSNAFRKYIRY